MKHRNYRPRLGNLAVLARIARSNASPQAKRLARQLHHLNRKP